MNRRGFISKIVAGLSLIPISKIAVDLDRVSSGESVTLNPGYYYITGGDVKSILPSSTSGDGRNIGRDGKVLVVRNGIPWWEDKPGT